MRKKISSLRLSTLSSGLILFAFFFLIQQFWEMVVSEFALLPSLAFIQILLMILSTFLISKFVKNARGGKCFLAATYSSSARYVLSG